MCLLLLDERLSSVFFVCLRPHAPVPHTCSTCSFFVLFFIGCGLWCRAGVRTVLLFFSFMISPSRVPFLPSLHRFAMIVAILHVKVPAACMSNRLPLSVLGPTYFIAVLLQLDAHAHTQAHRYMHKGTSPFICSLPSSLSRASHSSHHPFPFTLCFSTFTSTTSPQPPFFASYPCCSLLASVHFLSLCGVCARTEQALPGTCNSGDACGEKRTKVKKSEMRVLLYGVGKRVLPERTNSAEVKCEFKGRRARKKMCGRKLFV